MSCSSSTEGSYDQCELYKAQTDHVKHFTIFPSSQDDMFDEENSNGKYGFETFWD